MTTGQNSPDNFIQDLDDLVRDAMILLEGSATDSEHGTRTSEERQRNGELIESSNHLSFILHAPGYSSCDLRAAIVHQELVVEGPDFSIRRPLRASVKPSTLSSTYVNGVFHARVQRAL